MIEFQNVCKTYQKDEQHSINWVLKNFNLEIKSGECVALLGASGSGKSTCLKLINQLIQANQGKILFEGREIQSYDLNTLREDVAYVFQKGLLFPHLTVEENISIAIKKPNSETRVIELLELMDLNPVEFLDRYPHQLSGGQAQRVSLAQAMANDPKLLLMDEPFNGLDKKTKFALMQKILEIKKQFNKTIILVTHDHDEAEFMASRVIDFESIALGGSDV